MATNDPPLLLDEHDAGRAPIRARLRRIDAEILIGTRFDDGVLMTALGTQGIEKLIVFARVSQHPNTTSPPASTPLPAARSPVTSSDSHPTVRSVQSMR